MISKVIINQCAQWCSKAVLWGERDEFPGNNIQRFIVEGSLEAKLPTIWRDENAVRLSRSSEMQKVRRDKMQVREKVGVKLQPVMCSATSHA